MPTPDVVKPEKISIVVMSFKEGNTVVNGTFKELISKDAPSREYGIVYEDDTPIVIPEFPSFLILPLFMIATLLVVTVYRRKHSM